MKLREGRSRMQGTMLMALLQPAPEVFEVFDDVMLLSEGASVLQNGMLYSWVHL